MLAMTAPPSPRSVARHAKKSLTLDNIEWDSWDSAVFAGGQEVTLGQSKTEACFKTIWPCKDDVGPLSLTPRMLTPRKPHKLKALDVDLGKIIEAASDAYLDVEGDGFNPEKDEKKAKTKEEVVAKLQAQVRALQTRIDKVQIDMDRSSKSKAGATAKIEKLQAEHSILQARHTWAESSLESATAAQDEWRKHHESVRKSLKVAEEQLAKKEAEIAKGHENSENTDLKDMKADMLCLTRAQERHLQQTRENVKLVACEHKSRAERVLNRVVSGWASDFLLLSFKSWSGLAQQQKSEEATTEGAEATRVTKSSAELMHKQQAVCARFICNTNSDAAALAFKAWEEVATNLKRCSAASTPMQATWTSEPLLRVADHKRRQHSRELLMQVMMGWSMSTSRESAIRSREAKAQADFTRFESILQALGDQMTSVNEDLSEAVSELTASRLQSREIKQAIVESMELQAQLAKNWDAFESEWLGPEDDEFRSEFCQLKDDESDSEICPPKTMDEFEAEWWPAPPVVP